MSHATWRQVSAANIGQGGFGTSMLFGVVIFPFDADRPIISSTVQFDKDLFDTVGIAVRAGRHEIPAVEPMAHGAMTTQQAGPGMLANNLNALDVRTVNAVAKFAN